MLVLSALTHTLSHVDVPRSVLGKNVRMTACFRPGYSPYLQLNAVLVNVCYTGPYMQDHTFTIYVDLSFIIDILLAFLDKNNKVARVYLFSTFSGKDQVLCFLIDFGI